MSAPQSPGPLDLLCACLTAAQEGRALDAAAAAALSDRADLLGLARVAGRHYVTPMLAACLADPALRQRVPEDFVLYLEFIRAENRRRNAALRLQVVEIARCLNRIGIEPVLLKGAIRLVDGLYRDPGWRFMRDLDLLLERERAPDAVARLGSIGYRRTQAAERWPEHHRHLAPLYRDDDAAVVEIHFDLLPRRHDLCPAPGVMARSRVFDLDGARVRIPETIDQLAQLIGHDRFDGYLHRSGMFLLRSMFEVASLCREEGAVDRLLARAADVHLERCARVRLTLAAWLFPEYLQMEPVTVGERLQVGAAMAVERLDETARWRRLLWLVRALFGKLLTSRAEREQLARNILSLDCGRSSIRRLRQRWTSH